MPWLRYYSSVSFHCPPSLFDIIMRYYGKELCGNTLRKVIQKISDYRRSENHVECKGFTNYYFQLFPFVHYVTENLKSKFLSKRKSSEDHVFSGLQTMLTNSSWLFCYLINFLGVLWQKSIRNVSSLHFQILNFSPGVHLHTVFLFICLSREFISLFHMLKQLKLTNSAQRAFLCQQSRNQPVYAIVFMQKHPLLKRSLVCFLLFMHKVCQRCCRTN